MLTSTHKQRPGDETSSNYLALDCTLSLICASKIDTGCETSGLNTGGPTKYWTLGNYVLHKSQTFLPISGISSLSHADRGDLQFLLESNLRNILTAFANYTFCVQQSLQEKNAEVDSICDYLLGFTSDNHSIALLSGAKRAKLEEANSISKIFRFLKRECTSFLNYDIFECLIEHFQLDRDQEYLKYPDKLKKYVQKQRISEFIEIKPALSKYTDDMMKLTLVLDIDSMCRLDKLLDVAKAVAKIMGVLPSTLLIYDIRESCVEVTFLIPKSVAESIFSSGEVFSDNQREKFCQLLVKQLECNGYIFQFTAISDVGHRKDQTTSGK